MNQHMNTASEKLPLLTMNKTSCTSRRIVLEREEKKAKLHTQPTQPNQPYESGSFRENSQIT